ncbi:50S ribosomal protein L18 [Candidatus Shapirobacteria bacterium]|nr:50S ribosomal protein L18 [Candidatus Shapirobacteria bacterium]
MTKQVRINQRKEEQRQRRTRLKIKSVSDLPRLSVFRSSRYISAQIIDDQKGKTLIGVNEKMLQDKKGTKTERAYALGEYLAQRAKDKKIKKVVFDRGAYAYHGRVKALAEGARKGGLVF